MTKALSQPDLTPEEIENEELTEFDSAHEKEVADLNPKFRLIVEKIAWQVAREGLTIEEACLLKNVQFDWFMEQVESKPVVARIIAKKELEYKSAMLKPLNKKARLGDDKLAQWLLEKKFPEQFGPKSKKATGPVDDDLLEQAIQHIQTNGDNAPLVSSTTSVAFVKNVTVASGSSIIKKITEVLK